VLFKERHTKGQRNKLKSVRAKAPGNKKSKQSGGSKKPSSLKQAVKESIHSGARGVLTDIGSMAGSLLGPTGAKYGGHAANLLADIMGFGDYTVDKNSLSEGTQVPIFDAKGKRSLIVRHREFLQDVQGSEDFALQNFFINPGVNGTFPWLSGIANSFQEFKIHGLIFEFVSTSGNAVSSADAALGTVIMATNYNCTRPNFLNKSEMEQSEFSCSTKPSESLIHPIECDITQTPMPCQYIRTSGVPSGQDQRFYDLGNFQLATDGMQSAYIVGELWVSYEVEFLKPINGQPDVGATTVINNGPYDAVNTLGTLQTTPKGDLGMTVTNGDGAWDTLSFPPGAVGGTYLFTVTWIGVSTVLAVTAPTLFNCEFATPYKFGLDSFNYAANSGTDAIYIVEFAVKVTGAGAYVQFPGGSYTLPTSPATLDVIVVTVPSVLDV